MAARQQGMRIAELARRSGTTKETIHFYLREGLLRKPKKTSRNMAYYDETHLEQLRLIKRLRTESYLPLTVIKQVMKEGKLATSARHLDLAGDLFGQGARAQFEPLTRKELSERTGLSEKRITAYEDAKLLRPQLVGRTKRYGYEDVRVAEVIKQAEDEAGEGAEGLVLERFEILERHLKELVREEVAHFFGRILGESEPKNVLEVLQGGRETIGRFLGVARARRLREEVEKMMPAIEGVMEEERVEPIFFPLEERTDPPLEGEARFRHLVYAGDHQAAMALHAELKSKVQADLQIRVLHAECVMHLGKPDDAFAELERVRQELGAVDAFVEALWGSLCLMRLRHHFSELVSSTELIGYLARAFSAYEASRAAANVDPLVEARARLLMGRVLLVTPEFLGARPQGRADLERCLECVEELRGREDASVLAHLEENARRFKER